MSKDSKQLEEALERFAEAEGYFETAYLTYRLARQHLDQAEAAIDVARKAMDPRAVDEPGETGPW